MSTAGEVPQASPGPQGTTPRGMSEADTPLVRMAPAARGGRE